MLVLPKSNKVGVPPLVNDDLLGDDGLGAVLLLDQVVLAHIDSVGEVVTGGRREQIVEADVKPGRRFAVHLNNLMDWNR